MLIMQSLQNGLLEENINTVLPYIWTMQIKTGKTERAVFNLQTSYEFNSHFSIYAGIKNVLNHKYYESVTAGSGQKYYSPAPERNYYAGFRYQF